MTLRFKTNRSSLTYQTMVEKAQAYLREHEEIDRIVFKRPPARSINHYIRKGRQESFLRVPETCPTLTDIIREALPEECYDDLRNGLHARIHDRITEKFREEL